MTVQELIDILTQADPQGKIEIYALDDNNENPIDYYIKRVSEGNIIREVFIEIKPELD